MDRPAPERVEQVREAFAALTRALKRISVYRHAADQHAAFLSPALSTLLSLLAQEGSLTLSVDPNGLIWEGETVYSEPAREWSLCFRLYQAGIRELSFLRGITVDELRAFVGIAMPDALGSSTGREDALTELWKAELSCVQYRAADLDKGGADRARLAAAVSAARAALASQSAGISRVVEEEAAAAPPLLDPQARALLSDEAWGGLARRSSAALLGIIEAKFAGRDLDSLREAFARLIDEMLRRGEAGPLRAALERAAAIPAPMGPEFCAPLSARLAEPQRLAALAQMETSNEALVGAIPVYLALLGPGAGVALLDAAVAATAAGARPLLARAAAARLESCAARYAELLRTAPAETVRLLLSALEAAPPGPGASVAVAALGHRDARVLVEAIAHIARDPRLAPRHLGALLEHREAPVRVGAAAGLATAQPDAAAPLLLGAMSKPEFERAERAEREAFYRALGGLGSAAGFAFLSERLARSASRFKKARVEEEQLLAIRGLAAESSPRALRALEQAGQERELPPAVAAACRAAANHVRNQLSRKGAA